MKKHLLLVVLTVGLLIAGVAEQQGPRRFWGYDEGLPIRSRYQINATRTGWCRRRHGSINTKRPLTDSVRGGVCDDVRRITFTAARDFNQAAGTACICCLCVCNAGHAFRYNPAPGQKAQKSKTVAHMFYLSPPFDL